MNENLLQICFRADEFTIQMRDSRGKNDQERVDTLG